MISFGLAEEALGGSRCEGSVPTREMERQQRPACRAATVALVKVGEAGSEGNERSTSCWRR